MKIVIQCAGRKYEDAGRLTTPAGNEVLFVAHPEKEPRRSDYVRPDDVREGGITTWRKYLESYNQQGSNPNHLFSAGELYKPLIYRKLIKEFGEFNVFILSAGWGLVRADYLLPSYNISFSNVKNNICAKRNLGDKFEDFNQLIDCDIQPDETIYFFGGMKYLPIYITMTRSLSARKVVYHAQGSFFFLDGYDTIPYVAFINWHYKCAEDFINNHIQK